MKVLDVRNVREALPLGVQLLREEGKLEPSQYGDVLVYPTPVTTIYRAPTERVLLSAERDANPFLHVFEALWMLAGRQDTAFLNRYVKDFGTRFAEPDGIIHDAYGARWRAGFGFDQINAIVGRFIANPNDRQCVLQMWGAEVCAHDDLLGNWRTRPCNVVAFFRLNNGKLDMTVCCRSNDIVWGAYGSNAVHFSILQEYLAARIDCAVGVYYQISNNYHAYTAVLDKYDLDSLWEDYPLETQPLIHDPQTFDDELQALLKAIDDDDTPIKPLPFVFANRFLSDTAWPMEIAHRWWRKGDREAAVYATNYIIAEDWRTAACEWFERRIRKAKEKV